MKEEYFNLLVENAIDFLERSIEEFEKHPKYSVIHFYAAIELFVKARLMAEHWTLIVTRKEEPDVAKFEAGDFISVSLKEAEEVLGKALKDGLTKFEFAAFIVVAKHRNKMVHFYHHALSKKDSQELKQAIAKEQLRAWYLLHELLTGRWASHFDKWDDRLKGIDFKLRKIKKYLQVIFDEMKPVLKKLKDEGVDFKKCPSCGFRSQQQFEHIETLSEGFCKVCLSESKLLVAHCPHCECEMSFKDEGFERCKECNKDIDPQELASHLDEQSGSPKDLSVSGLPANCTYCDASDTVIEYKGKYFCTSCFNVYEGDELGCCDYCGEMNAGDMSDSGLTGCVECSGRLG